MIDFRYHIVSIVAVFLALAIGIVLGAVELQGHTLDALTAASNSLKSQLNAATTQRDSYEAQASSAGQFIRTSESALLGDGHLLAGRRVALVTEPGAPGSVINGVRQAVTAAGATVTGQVALQPAFNDLSGSTQSTLSSINGSIASSDGTTLTPGTDAQTSYQQQAAQLIAGAILTTATASPGPPAAEAQTLLKAYAQAGFISVSGNPADRASVAVFVTPASAPAGGATAAANEILVAIAQEFAAASAAAVVAGPTEGSAQPGSAISVLRSSSVSGKVSSIDNADTTQGQITVAQAIAVQLAGGKPNSYGVSGASAVSPDPVPTPSATATSTQGKGAKPVKKK